MASGIAQHRTGNTKMASLDDILSVHRNGVQGINGVSDTNLKLAGVENSGEISATTYLKTNLGWVAKISVIVAGSATGTVYDANSTAGAVNGNRLYIINNSVGIQTVMMPVKKGIVVAPGSGMIVAVSYS